METPQHSDGYYVLVLRRGFLWPTLATRFEPGPLLNISPLCAFQRLKWSPQALLALRQPSGILDINMVTNKQDVPYHMQEDSDEEEILGSDGMVDDQRESSNQAAKAEEKEKRRRARVGKVELDPNIRMFNPHLLYRS